ncbi:HAUS augmin-like complex subunit 6 N-terminus-domain-containing protein [Podospora appendiculata]|uniref:HAUS augmin-like complex subunit 6 N-terminus-domain-containing protein n=1 Tax=Podospora appendiculata TaxID=314037 RepID=A0AAE0X8X7_9PEZI|nr:HAUS augmin-like complex subunit 6 N-terminus-domain-containing protein [Podospora appendiculata]
MSSLQGSSFLARTRSSRVPANTSKPMQGSARAISSSTTSSVTSSAPPPTATATASSNISLFLTNLRLLDLDLHPDWPGINSLSFGTKDVAQGQKKRIQSVEWALYQLFTLWDPDEARNKLRPFFPPLDQVQSLNLRAALLRSLEHAKKNGVLGRDAVVRKTMLDECKGDRLAEVLAVFSSAVLKKLVAEQQLNNPDYPAVARTLSLENRGYSGERTQLTTLILAHKVSLRRGLQHKNAARACYKDFAELLKLKGQSIALRREHAEIARKKGTNAGPISDDLKLDIWRTVRNNWSGDERWMETLLYGDSKAHKDGLLSTPFDLVWRRVESGRLAELQDRSDGLLQQLEGRVESQNQRLEKWRSFRQKMFGKAGAGPATNEAGPRSKQSGIDLGFRGHENLHVGRLSPRKLSSSRPSELDGEYRELICSLETGLDNMDRSISRVPSFFRRPREAPRRPRYVPGNISPEPEAISELSDLEDELQAFHHPPPPREPMRAPEPATEPVLRRTRTLNYGRSNPIDGEGISASDLRRSATLQARHSILSGRRPANASPTRSPERQQTEDEESEPEPDCLPIKRGLTITVDAPPSDNQTSKDRIGSIEEDDEHPEYEDLAARTRRSMAGFEAARQKAQVERRRSLRKSKLITPTTPSAGAGGSRGNYFPAMDEEGDSTLIVEELMTAGQYDAALLLEPVALVEALGRNVPLDPVDLAHALDQEETPGDIDVAGHVHRPADRRAQPQLLGRRLIRDCRSRASMLLGVVVLEERVLPASSPSLKSGGRGGSRGLGVAAVAASCWRSLSMLVMAAGRGRGAGNAGGAAAAGAAGLLGGVGSGGLARGQEKGGPHGRGCGCGANRPSGLPTFQPPVNLPNINFNAPVIRLGATAPPLKTGAHAANDRKDSHTPTSGSRPGLGMERGLEQSRAQLRESMQSLVPPTTEERLRTIFVHKIPQGVGGEDNVQRLLGTVGRLRRWDSGHSHLTDHKGALFGFAQGDDPAADARMAEARAALKRLLRELFYPRVQNGNDADGDTAIADGANGAGENVEVVNIPLAQEDELADIPAEQRETVAAEIAAFRDRSNRRDLERLRREEEFEETERLRNGAPRLSRLDSPPPAAATPTVASGGNSNMIPLGPRGVPNAPSGPRGQNNRGVDFVNGGSTNGHSYNFREEDDTDASDDELYQRELAKQKAEDDKLYAEAERKWVNRERQRTAALERETLREKEDKEGFAQKREQQLEREKNWDDEREASRKSHPYYRNHAEWVRKRTADRSEEAAQDDMDRRAEAEERRRADIEMEQARGMADSFLERQAEEMERQPTAAAPAAPQRFTISFGAAAQRAQAQRAAPARRTVAEVEGLLDDEEHEQTTKRQLVPIKFEPITDTKAMTEEELQNAVRALAQEIPIDRDGLWAWDVKWDYLEESIIREKLRPFVEKKVVEYLGVQEQFLVDVVEEHLRKHSKPAELVETLGEALDEDAEDLVKKLWRMVIFFTESEKRGLPA